MPTDTPALLPPDPTMKAYYWLRSGTTSPGPWLWLPDTRSWFSKNPAGSVIRYAEGMASEGYTLASPHPIPGPAALEAVWELLRRLNGSVAELDDTANNSAVHRMTKLIRYRPRAALETKEDDKND